MVQPFVIPSESMENTLIQDDRVLASRFVPGSSTCTVATSWSSRIRAAGSRRTRGRSRRAWSQPGRPS
ncbi:S26 family signal peptidase [Oerskovia sp. M15]